jgi:hypothetical protein
LLSQIWVRISSMSTASSTCVFNKLQLSKSLSWWTTLGAREVSFCTLFLACSISTSPRDRSNLRSNLSASSWWPLILARWMASFFKLMSKSCKTSSADISVIHRSINVCLTDGRSRIYQFRFRERAKPSEIICPIVLQDLG